MNEWPEWSNECMLLSNTESAFNTQRPIQYQGKQALKKKNCSEPLQLLHDRTAPDIKVKLVQAGQRGHIKKAYVSTDKLQRSTILQKEVSHSKVVGVALV
jgi:hypothetical protein